MKKSIFMEAKGKYLSERDFVSQFVLPKIKEAAGIIGVSGLLDIHVDSKVDGGIADLYVERAGKRLFVLEAKFKKKIGKIERDIEPRDPEVIDQAVRYAVYGGFPYYLTCNLKRVILFQHLPDKNPFESELLSLEYKAETDWAEKILGIVLGQIRPKLKPLDDTLVDILHEAFEDLYPEILISLKKKLSEREYRNKYEKWLTNQGLEFNDETNSIIAEQACYLQINKLLFYQVIRTIYPDRLNTIEIGENQDVSEELSNLYDHVKKIDYSPVYESDVLSEVTLTSRAKERFRTLIDTLKEFEFSGIGADFLGRVYEKLIPPAERKKLGQFYTPPEIVDLIIKMVVNEPDNLILDPSCGSGSFLVKAYRRIKELRGIKDVGPLTNHLHKSILSQIFGIDINQFPAHLSVINLTIQKPQAPVDKINVAVTDFFNIKAKQRLLTGFEGINAEGSNSTVNLPSEFDVIVANPPYIRQELVDLDEKGKIKTLIEKEFNRLYIGKPPKDRRGTIVLDKHGDIYIYFYVHALSLIKEHGRIGFISSNKWLEVGYGEPFQQFLLDNCSIDYIIEFDRAVFEDADVNTSIVILRKETDIKSRMNNLVKFVRLKQKMNVDDHIKQLKSTTHSYENEFIRVNLVKEGTLKPGKWSVYLRGPPILQAILGKKEVRPLVELAKTIRAPTTGNNNFFILGNEEIKTWKIEKRYLKPCVSSSKSVDGLVVNHTKEWMLTVEDHIQDLNGTKVYDYIMYGQNLKVEVKRGSHKGERLLPDLETLSSRKPYWYSLPKAKIAPILFPYLIDKVPSFLKNDLGAVASDDFYYIYPNEEEYTDYLLAYLNSDITALLIELYGRSYGGGVLKVQVYETENIPVLDPNSLDKKEVKSLGSLFNDLASSVSQRILAEQKFKELNSKKKGNRGLFDKELSEALTKAQDAESLARNRLNRAIFDAFGFGPEERDQIENSLHELQALRVSRTKVQD